VRVRPVPRTPNIQHPAQPASTRRTTGATTSRRNMTSAVPNADKDYIRNYNGPKVAIVG
jgi:hypothetical protein